MTRRPTVVRSHETATARAVNRGGVGVSIYCDINESPPQTGTPDTGGPVTVSRIPLTIESNYTRVFFAATLNEVFGDDGPFSIIARIRNGGEYGAGPEIAPGGQTFQRRASLSFTGSYDLPAGDYDWQLWIASDNSDLSVWCDVATMQIIVGQVVPEQHCYNQGGSG